MRRSVSLPVVLVVLVGILHPQPALSFGAQGHEFSGAIADRLLNPRAAAHVHRLLGMKLEVASTWADCAKDVAPGPDGFRYVADPRYHLACHAFENPGGIARMNSYVSRNWNNCDAAGRVTACHKTYHFADVAIQHDRYDRAFTGTSDHDVVSALNAAIGVLRGHPAPAPFSVNDKKEALLLLAHLVGDVHQPMHVSAIYLDAHDHATDPDAGATPFDPTTSTRGGNSIIDGSTNLHAEWDAVPAPLQPNRIRGTTLVAARRVAPNPNEMSTWPTAWAAETVLASRLTFEGLSFQRDAVKPGQWTVQFDDRAGYLKRKDELQTRQLIKAGARLAQLLNALWPSPVRRSRAQGP